MKRAIILLLALACLLPLTLTTAHPLQSEPTPPPVGSPPFNLEAQVEAAIYQAIESGRQTAGVPALYITEVEQVRVSQDAAWASAWLVLTDPKSGEALPSEPSLALAQREADGWQVTLPGEPGWETWLEASPTDLLPLAIREEWLQANREDLATAQTEAIRGFLLPWEKGKTVWLSRSVTHVNDYTSGYYAWDFYISGQMYNLYASRGGTVWLASDSVPNNNHDDVNYLVIKDETTTPVSYHLYLHLAQNSIPNALKTVGAPVVQGQFIGIADNTGASTGHHLHFHVFTSPSWKYWGPSVDITFDDVAINGGRPRRTDELDDCKSGDVCVSGANSYVSGNTVRIGPTPPEGDILDPINAVTISVPTMHLEGWASDTDSGLSSAQFIAEWDNVWHPIGSSFSTLQFEMDWDLCSDQVPDGPVSLALKLRDNAGSQSIGLPGLRHFTKNYTCPPVPPACVPGDSQVAIFADPDYHGACNLLDSGSYLDATALGSLGGDNAASIQVGDNVQATLYSKDSKTGRSETFSGNDSNLADNRIGANTVSSALIEARLTAQALPEVTVQEDILPNIEVGSTSPSAPQAPLPVPFYADMESGSAAWTSNSLWRTTTDNNHTPEKTTSWRYSQADGDYDNGVSNSGSLTSPAIAIPASGESYLRFWYLYETESISPYWDQRKVQISKDGGAFSDVLQLAYDPPGLWLQSPVIDLKPYAGHSIQIRFYFNTLDEVLNKYKGWYIDDLSISSTPPPACSKPGDLDETPATALGLSYNTSVAAEICPGGDVDYYKFNGTAGDQVGAAVAAQAAGSKLDAYLFLLDADGASVLASGDDLIPYQLNDAHLSYTLPRTGVYYLKMRAWDHPSAGGLDFGYTLRLFEEKGDPSAQILPASGSKLSGETIPLHVTATDEGSGVSHVEFLWHSGDWETGSWTILGEDWDGQDGWSYPLDLSKIQPQGGLAIYARVYDSAGNWIGTGAWDLMKVNSFSFFPFIAR